MDKKAMLNELIQEKCSGNASAFARLLGVSQGCVSGWQHSENKNPDLDLIASTFPDISAEWLMRGEGSMYKDVAYETYNGEGIPLIPTDAMAGELGGSDFTIDFRDCEHYVVPDITTYTARYTFASIAAECGISREIIHTCLAHAWGDIDAAYIAYQQKQVDEAVFKVIDYVYKKE